MEPLPERLASHVGMCSSPGCSTRDPEQAVEDGSAISVRNQEDALVSCLFWPCPALVLAPTWGVKLKLEDLSNIAFRTKELLKTTKSNFFSPGIHYANEAPPLHHNEKCDRQV